MKCGDVIEFRLVEVFSRLALPRGFCRRRAMQLSNDCSSREKFCASSGCKTVLQPLIKDERIAQIQDRVLIGGTLDRLEFVRLLALIVDLFQERREFGETEIFPVALFPAEQAEHFGILNNENRILIGHRRVEKRIRQPFAWR